MISNYNKKIEIVTSVKSFENKIIKNKPQSILLQKDILSTDAYTLGYLKNSQSGLDYTKKLITV